MQSMEASFLKHLSMSTQLKKATDCKTYDKPQKPNGHWTLTSSEQLITSREQ